MKILYNLLPTVIDILFKPIFMLLILHNAGPGGRAV
jgi:hypothetical protein